MDVIDLGILVLWTAWCLSNFVSCLHVANKIISFFTKMHEFFFINKPVTERLQYMTED